MPVKMVVKTALRFHVGSFTELTFVHCVIVLAVI